MTADASTTETTTEKPAKAAKIEQNGVSRPRAGTQTGRVWEIADELSNAAGEAAKRSDVVKTAEAEGINVSTVATQYGKWRKFHGLVAERAPGKTKGAEAATTEAATTETAPA